MTQDRRRFLQTLALGAALPLLPTLPGCGGDPESRTGTVPEARVPLALLRDGERLNVKVGDEAVELTRQGDEIIARSLICTHQGCVVAWVAAENQYVCPCHEGRFNAEGKPVYGSPRQPLLLLDVDIVDGEVVVRG